MSLTFSAKPTLDTPEWRPWAVPKLSTSATYNYANNHFANGTVLLGDLRNDITREPHLYFFYNNSYAYRINPITEGWAGISNQLATSLSSSLASITLFHAGQSPSGTIAAGATTTTIPLTTALPAAVGINQLAERGDGRGYYIRIIGNAAGSSGKIETRYVIGNTAGTTPTLTLDSALTFTPAEGDTYEFLSGSIYICLGTSANNFKRYDILTNSWSAALSTTGLTMGSNASSVVLCENYVPYNRASGEGYLGSLTATAMGATSLTGQAAAGDAGVLENEYRNFQIRIIEDTSTPTAVGQRRRIVSHTAGVSPVYTVAAWTVEPSAIAKYVIENDNDKILMWSATNTNTYTYNITANTWDTTTFVARGSVSGGGAWAAHGFSYVDSTKNARNSMIYCIRGQVNNYDNIDVLNISGGTGTGSWENDAVFGGKSPSPTNANIQFQYMGYIQNSINQEGKYLYLISNYITQLAHAFNLRINLKNRQIEPFSANMIGENGILASAGYSLSFQRKGGVTCYIDGSDKLVQLAVGKAATGEINSCILFDNI